MVSEIELLASTSTKAMWMVIKIEKLLTVKLTLILSLSLHRAICSLFN